MQSQTLLEDDPVRVEHFFGLARETPRRWVSISGCRALSRGPTRQERPAASGAVGRGAVAMSATPAT